MTPTLGPKLQLMRPSLFQLPDQMTFTDDFLKDLPEVGPKGYDPKWDDVKRSVLPGVPAHSMYFDREGRPISMRTWVRLWNYMDYRRIDGTYIGGYWVSTVWLGTNHAFHGVSPLIFEMMVFEAEPSISPSLKETEIMGIPFPAMPSFLYHRDFGQERYSTEEAARAGHARIVKQIETLIAAMPDPRDLPVLKDE